MLKDQDKSVRCEAAWALLTTRGTEAKDAIAVLIELLSDKDANARRGAASAVRVFGPDAKAAVPALIELLKDKSREMREAAIPSLGAIGPAAKSAIPALLGNFPEGGYRRSLLGY